MSDDAVKLAMYMIERGDDPPLYGPNTLTLARAVIAQAEELERLRTIAWTCPRCGRGDLQAQHAVQHRQSCMSRTDDEYERDDLKAELERVKAGLREACNLYDETPKSCGNWSCGSSEDAAITARIAELRKLVTS